MEVFHVIDQYWIAGVLIGLIVLPIVWGMRR